MQTVEVTMFIVAAGAGKDTSRHAGAKTPPIGKATGRQAGSGSGRNGRRAASGAVQAQVKQQEDEGTVR